MLVCLTKLIKAAMFISLLFDDVQALIKDANCCSKIFSTKMSEGVFPKTRLSYRVLESQPISRALDCHVK